MADLSLAFLLVLAYLYAFWCAYIAVMGVYRAHLSGRLVGVAKWLAYPLVLTGVTLDVVAQYTIATAVFLDWPQRGEHLVTSRLVRYTKFPGTWRHTLAVSVCTSLLDVFDPTGRHCA